MVKVNGFNYMVFVTSDGMKYFGCGVEGHLICYCLKRLGGVAEEVVKGCLLKVTAHFEQVTIVYINGPTNELERIVAFNILCNVIQNSNYDDFLLLEGGF